MTEGRRWLTEALEASEGVPPAVLAQGVLRRRLRGARAGRLPAGEAVLRARASSSRARPATCALEAQALQQIGWLVMTRGKLRGRARRAGARARRQGARARAVDRRQARAVGRAQHPRRARRPRRATRRPRTSSTSRASALRRELGDKRLIANSVLTLGRAELTRGDYERATPLLQEGLALAQRAAATRGACRSRSPTSAASRCSDGGDTAEAAKLFADGARAREGARRQARRGRVPAGARGRDRRRSGDGAQAARLFGAGDALLEAIGATPTTIEVAISERFVPAGEGEPRRRALRRRVGGGPRRAARGGDRARARRGEPPGPRRRVARVARALARHRRRWTRPPMARKDEARGPLCTRACTARGRSSSCRSRSSRRSWRRSSGRTTTPARSCGRS